MEPFHTSVLAELPGASPPHHQAEIEVPDPAPSPLPSLTSAISVQEEPFHSSTCSLGEVGGYDAIDKPAVEEPAPPALI